MLRGADVNDIKQFKREGLTINQISSLTGRDKKTIRKYLKQPRTPQYGPRSKRPTLLDPFVPYIKERLAAGVWNAVVLLAELKQRGYTGGYTVVKDYLRPLREEAEAVAVRRPPPHRGTRRRWTGENWARSPSRTGPSCPCVGSS